MLLTHSTSSVKLIIWNHELLTKRFWHRDGSLKKNCLFFSNIKVDALSIFDSIECLKFVLLTFVYLLFYTFPIKR